MAKSRRVFAGTSGRGCEGGRALHSDRGRDGGSELGDGSGAAAGVEPTQVSVDVAPGARGDDQRASAEGAGSAEMLGPGAETRAGEPQAAGPARPSPGAAASPRPDAGSSGGRTAAEEASGPGLHQASRPTPEEPDATGTELRDIGRQR